MSTHLSTHTHIGIHNYTSTHTHIYTNALTDGPTETLKIINIIICICLCTYTHLRTCIGSGFYGRTLFRTYTHTITATFLYASTSTHTRISTLTLLSTIQPVSELIPIHATVLPWAAGPQLGANPRTAPGPAIKLVHKYVLTLLPHFHFHFLLVLLHVAVLAFTTALEHAPKPEFYI